MQGWKATNEKCLATCEPSRRALMQQNENKPMLSNLVNQIRRNAKKCWGIRMGSASMARIMNETRKLEIRQDVVHSFISLTTLDLYILNIWLGYKDKG